MFAEEIYKNRRNELKSKFTSGILLFLGNEESSMNYPDNTYPFRQDSSFLYYFGLDFPSLAAIIDIDENKEIVFGDELSIDYIVWMGTQPTLRERCQRCGVTNTQPYGEITSYLNKAKQNARNIHFLPPYRPENKIKLFEYLGILPSETKEKSSKEFTRAVVEQRAVKTKEEIEEIEYSCTVSAKMHLAAMQHLKAGMKEAEIAAIVQQTAFADNGYISFPVIATINGQTLHNHFHGNTTKEGQLFLLDAGYESALHYAGDLTSTFPVSKKFTPLQKDIFNINIAAYHKAVSMLKPGINFKEIHLAACTVIAEGMKNLGFLKGNIADMVNEGAHALFMPHGLGHMMGLDVHDMEDLDEEYVGYEGRPRSTQFGLKSLRLARELKTGFVHTIEPGIYFIPELIDKWRSEKKFLEFINFEKVEEYKTFGGIRNEADYLITETGARMLGTELPRTIEKIEAIREG